MDNFIKNNNDILTLLLDEEEYEDIIFGYLEPKKKKLIFSKF
jgi:hypothetical protein